MPIHEDGLCRTCARPGMFWLYDRQRGYSIVCEAHGQSSVGDGAYESIEWGRLDTQYRSRPSAPYMPEIVPDGLPRHAYRDHAR